MKAFFATRYGGPEVMKVGELPDPSPRAGEVLVAVKAASVNPVDWKVRKGGNRVVSGRPPKILGTDFSGTVAALGTGVSGIAVGSAVHGTTRMMFGSQGSHAERVAVPAKRVAPVPAGLSFEEAAALPVAALTALNGFRLCGELQGRAVIVVGATGGVGHFAVQIARARGARVTAVCSGKNVERARALGAEEVMDYGKADFTRGNQRWDVVFDAHGEVGFKAAGRVLSERGVYATTLAGPGAVLRHLWQRLAGGKQLALANLRDRPEDYAELAQLVAERGREAGGGAGPPTRAGGRGLRRAGGGRDGGEGGHPGGVRKPWRGSSQGTTSPWRSALRKWLESSKSQRRPAGGLLRHTGKWPPRAGAVELKRRTAEDGGSRMAFVSPVGSSRRLGCTAMVGGTHVRDRCRTFGR